MKGFFIAVAMAALLPACSTQSTKQQHHILVEWYGDSTTNGVTFKNNEYIKLEQTEARIVQSKLAGEYPSVDIEIISKGAGGTTASQLLNGSERYKNKFPAQMEISKADIVVINFGINDAYVPGNSPEKFGNDLASLIEAAKASGKAVIIETPNPINKEHNQVLWAYQNQISVVGDKAGVPVIPQWSAMMRRDDWRALLSDEIHPTQEGYSVKAANSLTVLREVVRGVLSRKSR